MPLPGNPGNIFVSGMNVVVPVPGRTSGNYRVIDYDGKLIEQGAVKDEKAVLGRVPVGFYTLNFGSGSVTLGVLARLESPIPADSPIAVVSVPSGFYQTQRQFRIAASLVGLAGIRWAGDHCSWPAIEPQRGTFARHVANDDADSIFSEAGIQVMNTLFAAPPWTHAEENRFPSDLRVVFAFYEHLARRWRGKVAAIEPWNEPNFWMSGAEMASYQKAAYLGVKAGDPRMIVGSESWAILPHVLPTAGMEREFGENGVAPYFDTYNFHHYSPISDLPAIYREQRPYAAGKPIWVTEFNHPVKVKPGSPLEDPSPHDMRIQTERVPKLFAATLTQGVQRAFYFIFGNYTELGYQFGVVYQDFTPRPTYLALAAVGRLLAGAKPLGRVAGGNAADQVYAFSAKPDGQSRDVLVAWTSGRRTKLAIPTVPVAIYDTIGREVSPGPSGTLSLSGSPIFIVLPAGSVRAWARGHGNAGTIRLRLPATHDAGSAATARPSFVVLQAVFQASQLVKTPPVPEVPKRPLVHTQVRMSSPGGQAIRLYAYNFSPAELQIHVGASAPPKWNYSMPRRAFKIAPGGRVAIPFEVTAPAGSRGVPASIKVRASDSKGGTSILRFSLMGLSMNER